MDVNDDGDIVEVSKVTDSIPDIVSPRPDVASVKTARVNEGGTDANTKSREENIGRAKSTDASTDDESKRAEKLVAGGEALPTAKPVRRNSNPATTDSTKTIRRNSKIPSFTDSEFNVVVGAEALDLDDIECSSARNLIEKRSSGNVVTTEVNVENFLKEALSTLLRQGFLATEPICLEDQLAKNIQVGYRLRLSGTAHPTHHAPSLSC